MQWAKTDWFLQEFCSTFTERDLSNEMVMDLVHNMRLRKDNLVKRLETQFNYQLKKGVLTDCKDKKYECVFRRINDECRVFAYLTRIISECYSLMGKRWELYQGANKWIQLCGGIGQKLVLSSCILGPIHFMVNFDGNTLENSNLSGVSMEKGSCIEADFSNSELKSVNFRRADLRGAKFIGADLEGAIFNDSDLRSANFLEAKNLDKANWDGAKLLGSIIPNEYKLVNKNGVQKMVR